MIIHLIVDIHSSSAMLFRLSFVCDVILCVFISFLIIPISSVSRHYSSFNCVFLCGSQPNESETKCEVRVSKRGRERARQTHREIEKLCGASMF